MGERKPRLIPSIVLSALVGLLVGGLALGAVTPPVVKNTTPPSATGTDSYVHFATANVTHSAANTDLVSTFITPLKGSSVLSLTISTVTTNSVVDLVVKKGADTAQVIKLNGGTALTASVLYTFNVNASDALTYNVRLETGCGLGVFELRECGGASLGAAPPQGAGSSGVAASRAINTTAPLTGGGDLSADRTIALPTLANGALLIGNGTSSPATATLTQGSGITITNSAGGITIAASGGGGSGPWTGGTALDTTTTIETGKQLEVFASDGTTPIVELFANAPAYALYGSLHTTGIYSSGQSLELNDNDFDLGSGAVTWDDSANTLMLDNFSGDTITLNGDLDSVEVTTSGGQVFYADDTSAILSNATGDSILDLEPEAIYAQNGIAFYDNGVLPGSPAGTGISGAATVYCTDAGGGKKKLMVKFPSGAAVQLGTEP